MAVLRNIILPTVKNFHCLPDWYISKENNITKQKFVSGIPIMPGQNMLRSCKAVTDEQKRRLEASGNRGLYRSDASTLLDYTIAIQKGHEWRQDLAKFGLPLEERQ